MLVKAARRRHADVKGFWPLGWRAKKKNAETPALCKPLRLKRLIKKIVSLTFKKGQELGTPRIGVFAFSSVLSQQPAIRRRRLRKQ